MELANELKFRILFSFVTMNRCQLVLFQLESAWRVVGNVLVLLNLYCLNLNFLWFKRISLIWLYLIESDNGNHKTVHGHEIATVEYKQTKQHICFHVHCVSIFGNSVSYQWAPYLDPVTFINLYSISRKLDFYALEKWLTLRPGFVWWFFALL